MFPVIDDFAEIACRLKEIQAEVAKAKAAAEAKRRPGEDSRPASQEVYDDTAACG